PSAHYIRASDQPEDGEGPGPHDPPVPAGTRGRGHRVVERRAFMGVLAGGILATPLAADAQQAGQVWPICVLLASDSPTLNVEAFRQELRNLGYIEGRNALIAYRWHEGKVDRLPALADELVNLKPDLILVAGVQPPLALKAATTTVPIVFAGTA